MDGGTIDGLGDLEYNLAGHDSLPTRVQKHLCLGAPAEPGGAPHPLPRYAASSR